MDTLNPQKTIGYNTNIMKNFTTGTGCSHSFGLWSNPQRIEVNEIGETIEMIYKETSQIVASYYPFPRPEERVFKIVYSVVDGKWHKSERIYGKIIPEQAECYIFES